MARKTGGLLSETTRPRGVAGVDHRPVLNGIFRVLRSGEPWHRVPLVHTIPAISARDLNPVKVRAKVAVSYSELSRCLRLLGEPRGAEEQFAGKVALPPLGNPNRPSFSN
jgi:hypothetical protein